MRLDERDLEELRSLAARAACEAGALIETLARTDVAVERKEAGDSLASQVVTEVDRRAEARVLSVLAPSRERFNLGILSEERGDDGSRFESSAFWCIDPLDGTLPFVEGVEGYSVSIALVSRAGVPLVGVVYDPRNRVLFEAIKGSGARIDGSNFRISASWLASDSVSVFSDRSSGTVANHQKVLQRLGAKFAQGGVSNRVGFGAALNACSILREGLGCYFKLPKEKSGGGSVWDFAAAACIVSEAGGCVSDMRGNPLSLNPKDSLLMNEKGVLFATDSTLVKCIRIIDKII